MPAPQLTQNQRPSQVPLSSNNKMTDEEADQLMLQQTALKYPSRGMQNLGNTCFFNSVMQCITHTKPFLNYILSKKHTSNCNKRENCSLCLYSQYAINFEKTGNTSPQLIISKLKQYWPQYRRGAQEDAHEFLLYFFESFINGCFNGIKPDRLMVNKNQQFTPIFKIFGGKTRSQVHCQGCGYKSNTYEDIISLSLDFPKNQQQQNQYNRNRRGYQGFGDSNSPVTFESCLNEFCKSELLSGQNKYMCSNCKKKCDAKKRFSIEVSPRILIVHFKRFTNMGSKINAKVTYPSHFSLKSFMSETIDKAVDRQLGINSNQHQQQRPNKIGDEQYELFGVVIHLGSGCRSGHYYSYCKDPQNQWFKLDDETKHITSEGAALSNQAYILFYQKKINPTKQIKVKDDEKLISQNNSILSQKSTSVSSSSASERESNHQSDETKHDYVELKRYSSVMPSNRDSMSEQQSLTPQKQAKQEEKHQAIKKSNTVISKPITSIETLKPQQQVKQETNQIQKEQKQVQKELSQGQIKECVAEPTHQQPKQNTTAIIQTIGKQENLSDNKYLKSLLQGTMKISKQQQENKQSLLELKNLNKSDIIQTKNKKDEIKKILSGNDNKKVDTLKNKKDQKLDNKDLKKNKSENNLNSSEKKAIQDFSLSNIQRLSNQDLQQIVIKDQQKDDILIKDLQSPKLVKQSSSKLSGSFIGGLRRSLHPVVLNLNTKKRKLSAQYQLLVQMSINDQKNAKRFKHNDNE